ncbi:hypothetical protein [Neisseria sp. Ec49-e6-T10]|uniref:hypothetical protein n=1 Tax=Neisseria sp. Ec49-e6-T10 TaxID=3140744 RepID=UPI003EB85775
MNLHYKKIVYVFLRIIGTSWFALFTFLVLIFIGTHITSIINARNIDSDTPPFSQFYILFESPDENKIFPVLLINVEEFQKNNQNISLFLQKNSGEIEKDSEKWKYTVHEKMEGIQEIQVLYQGEDERSESIYLSGKNGITLKYSRILIPGYMFHSIPYALLLSIIIHFSLIYLCKCYNLKHKLN